MLDRYHRQERCGRSWSGFQGVVISSAPESTTSTDRISWWLKGWWLSHSTTGLERSVSNLQYRHWYLYWLNSLSVHYFRISETVCISSCFSHLRSRNNRFISTSVRLSVTIVNVSLAPYSRLTRFQINFLLCFRLYKFMRRLYATSKFISILEIQRWPLKDLLWGVISKYK